MTLHEVKYWPGCSLLVICVNKVCVCSRSVCLVCVFLCCLARPLDGTVSRATLIFWVIFLFSSCQPFVTIQGGRSLNMFLSYLKYLLRLSWYAICTDRDPHPFCDSCLEKRAPRKCQAKNPAEQMSRWPSGCLWFCLLYVEVSFCCMRRSAVSLGCSEPGWERWREGTNT